MRPSLSPWNWERLLIKVELNFAILSGFYGWIVGRSGLANVHGIVAFNCTVDVDYQETVWIILFNLSNIEHDIKVGNPIVQLIIEKCYDVKFVEYNELTDTKRSIGGFGSSGGF